MFESISSIPLSTPHPHPHPHPYLHPCPLSIRFSPLNPAATAFFQVLEGDAPGLTMVVTDLHRSCTDTVIGDVAGNNDRGSTDESDWL